MKKALSVVLALIICLSSVSMTAYAASNTHLSKTKMTLSIGQSVTLSLKDKKNKKISSGVKWSTDDKKIATVSKGKVNGVKEGKTVVFAKYKGKKYKCTIKVRNSVSVDKTSVTIKKGTKSKTVNVTFKENNTISFKIISGEDLIDCEWSKKWDGDNTKLKIIRKYDNEYGTAKVKVYSKKYTKNYVIITVNLKSPYTLKVKNKLPCVLYNYESENIWEQQGISNSVTINKVDYEIVYGDSMKITVDFTARSSKYSGADYYYIFYKAVDNDGYVIGSSYERSDRLRVGDKAKKEIYFYDIPEGTVTIEFLDYYASV